METEAGGFDFDALVIALGAETAPEMMPGFAETAVSPYTLDGAVATREAVAGFNEGKIVVMVASLPFKCPAAPYEAALLIDHGLRKRGVRGGVDMEFITPEPQPMLVAGRELGRMVEVLLAGRRITYRPNLLPESVDVEGKAVSLAGGERVAFDLLVGIPPHRAPAVVRESGLGNEAGWIPVHHNTMATVVPGVYAIGDVTAIITPSGMPLPKAGVFAEGQAKTVAAVVAGYMSGKTEPAANFYGHGTCFLETGGGMAGRATGRSTPSRSRMCALTRRDGSGAGRSGCLRSGGCGSGRLRLSRVGGRRGAGGPSPDEMIGFRAGREITPETGCGGRVAWGKRPC